MLKKYLLTASFLCAAVVLTGCNAEKQAEQPKVSCIITTEVPTQAAPNVKDETTGFIKINPHFTAADIPAAPQGKTEWVKDNFGSNLPPFPNGSLLEVVNTADSFVAYVGNTTEEDFRKYFETLAAEGFKFTDNNSWENFNMERDDIAVNLRYWQDGPKVITVRAKLIKPQAAEQKPAEAKAPAKEADKK